MLKFTVHVRVLADAPESEDMKKVFMSNCEDVIQQGLIMMTVPDWTATVVELEEEDD